MRIKLFDAPPKVRKGKRVMISTRPMAAAKEEPTTALYLVEGVTGSTGRRVDTTAVAGRRRAHNGVCVFWKAYQTWGKVDNGSVAKEE